MAFFFFKSNKIIDLQKYLKFCPIHCVLINYFYYILKTLAICDLRKFHYHHQNMRIDKYGWHFPRLSTVHSHFWDIFKLILIFLKVNFWYYAHRYTSSVNVIWFISKNFYSFDNFFQFNLLRRSLLILPSLNFLIRANCYLFYFSYLLII